MYFVDLCKGKPKLTDTARCIKARHDSGITNRSTDNSGVFYGCRAVLTPDRENKRQNGQRMKNCGEPAFCLNTQDKHGVYLCACDICDKALKIREATKAGYKDVYCGDCVNFTFPDAKHSAVVWA